MTAARPRYRPSARRPLPARTPIRDPPATPRAVATQQDTPAPSPVTTRRGFWGGGPGSALEPTPTSALQACQNPCCNATTCQLAAGAHCAQGACCRRCSVSPGPPGWSVGRGPEEMAGSARELCSAGQVTPAGELCRPPKDACDLEEYCDGQQPACPEDVFQENGTPCPGGYCYDGVCPALAQRCQDLWGPGEAWALWHVPTGCGAQARGLTASCPHPAGSQVAEETCYTFSMPPGCPGGPVHSSSR